MIERDDHVTQAVHTAYIALREILNGVEAAGELHEIRDIDGKWLKASTALARYDDIQGIDVLDDARKGLLNAKAMVDSAIVFLSGNRDEEPPGAAMSAAYGAAKSMRAALIADGVSLPGPEWFEED